MEDQHADELNAVSDETHRYGFPDNDASLALEAGGRATASAGRLSPPSSPHLPL